MKNQNQTTLTLVGLVFLVILSLPMQIRGQSLTISGKITDMETGEPIAFATVAIKNETFGTITNLAGEFDFHITGTNHSGILIVRMLGYMDFEKNLSQLNSAQPLIIKMVNIGNEMI